MKLRRIIKIEERANLKGKKICRGNGNSWVLFTDTRTGSSGIMPEYQLKQLYERMVGVSSSGKQMYMERFK